MSQPEPFVPGQPAKIEFAMPDVLHDFRAGHRIMVQIQSSWFPLVDRNPQQFEDIPNAKHRLPKGRRTGLSRRSGRHAHRSAGAGVEKNSE